MVDVACPIAKIAGSRGLIDPVQDRNVPLHMDDTVGQDE